MSSASEPIGDPGLRDGHTPSSTTCEGGGEERRSATKEGRRANSIFLIGRGARGEGGKQSPRREFGGNPHFASAPPLDTTRPMRTSDVVQRTTRWWMASRKTPGLGLAMPTAQMAWSSPQYSMGTSPLKARGDGGVNRYASRFEGKIMQVALPHLHHLHITPHTI